MDRYHLNPTPMGWELTDKQTREALLHTVTKEEMFSELDGFMTARPLRSRFMTATEPWRKSDPIPAAGIGCDRSSLVAIHRQSWSNLA